MYYIDRTVAFSETGPDNKIKITNLIDYYQDVCTFQSTDLGVGTEYLKEHGIGWVATSWQIVVNRYPALDEKIRIGTAPYGFKGAMGLRNFIMETPEGEVLSVVNSIWSMVSRETGTLVRVDADTIGAYTLEPKLDMEYAPRKIAIPSELAACAPLKVEYHHLDFNNHVNNAQYISMAEDLIPEGRRAKQIRVEYRASAHADDTIMPYVGHVVADAGTDAGASNNSLADILISGTASASSGASSGALSDASSETSSVASPASSVVASSEASSEASSVASSMTSAEAADIYTAVLADAEMKPYVIVEFTV